MSSQGCSDYVSVFQYLPEILLSIQYFCGTLNYSFKTLRNEIALFGIKYWNLVSWNLLQLR